MRENGFLRRSHRSIHDVITRKGADVPELVIVDPTTSVRVALSTITSFDVSQLPVVLDGECVGSLTEGELMSTVIENPELLDRPVESVMTAPFPVVDSHLDADEAARLLTRENPAVLVRVDGKLKGILTRYDVVRALTGAAG